MLEYKQMATDTVTKARLLIEALKSIKEGKSVKCDGLDDSELCCDPITRNIYDCNGCPAIKLIGRYIAVNLVEKGTIQKERAS